MFKDKKLNIPLMIWLTYFVINVVVSLQMKTLLVEGDEYIPLAIPAYLAGNDWSESISKIGFYYGYGQTIWYTPLFLFLKDGVLIYKFSSVINSIFISFIPVMVYSITYNFFNVRNKKMATLVAFTVSLVPCYLSITKYVWNETFIYVLTWVVLWLMTKLYMLSEENKDCKLLSAVLGFILVYGYSVHGRFLGLIATVFFVIVAYRIILKKNLINYVYFIVTFIATYLIDGRIKQYFSNKIWLQDNVGELNNTFATAINKIILQITNNDTLSAWLRAFSTYTFCLVVASLGILMLAYVLYFTQIKKYFVNKFQDSEEARLLFFGTLSVLAMLAAIVIMILFFTSALIEPETEITNYYIYNRYTEYLLGPILLFTLMYVYKNGLSYIQCIISSLLVFASLFYTYTVELEEITTKSIAQVSSLTLLSFTRNISLMGNTKGFIFILVMVMSVFIIVTLLFKNNKFKQAFFVIILIYSISYINSSKNWVIKYSDERFQWTELTYEFFDKSNLSVPGEYKKVYIYSNPASLRHLYIADYEVIPYIDTNTELDENTFIIASAKVSLNCDYSKLYQLKLNKPNEVNQEYIFVYGSELYNELSSQGYEFLNNECTLGEIIYLNNEKYSSTILGEGWSGTESWGTWSDGQESILNFKVVDISDNDLTFKMNASAFNSDKDIAIYVNDEYLTEITVLPGDTTEYRVDIPREMIDGDEISIKLEFKGEMESPKSLNFSGDYRKLGIAVTDIVIE